MSVICRFTPNMKLKRDTMSHFKNEEQKTQNKALRDTKLLTPGTATLDTNATENQAGPGC